MAWQTLPTPTTTRRQTIITLLGEVRYRCAWQYCARLDLWTLSMSTAAGEAIFTGRHVLHGLDLFRRSRHLAVCPAGKLFALNSNVNDATPANSASLGKTMKLYWNPAG